MINSVKIYKENNVNKQKKEIMKEFDIYLLYTVYPIFSLVTIN